jgi:hypothetical protein
MAYIFFDFDRCPVNFAWFEPDFEVVFGRQKSQSQIGQRQELQPGAAV